MNPRDDLLEVSFQDSLAEALSELNAFPRYCRGADRQDRPELLQQAAAAAPCALLAGDAARLDYGR